MRLRCLFNVFITLLALLAFGCTQSVEDSAVASANVDTDYTAEGTISADLTNTGNTADGWNMDETYTLTIENQSGMDNFAALMMQGRRCDNLGFCYEVEGENIQSGYRNTIAAIIIKDGVESVPDYTFMDFTAMESCTLPQSLLTIGCNAFVNCVSLKVCSLPDSITDIGDNAFVGCSKLESINVPKSVVELKYGTFLECDALKELTVPANVKVIREYAIDSANMERFIFEGTVEYIEGIYLTDMPKLQSIVFLQAQTENLIQTVMMTACLA